jgi:hypothetical protein
MAATTSPILNNISSSATNSTTAADLITNAKTQTSSLTGSSASINTALDSLIDSTAGLASVSAKSFIAIVSHIALNQSDQARLVFLAEDASFEEEMGTLDSDDAAANQAKANSDALWAAIEAVAIGLLKIAGSAAVPLLLAAL